MSPTYDYMDKQASFHSRQGRLWRLVSKFLLVCFRTGMSHEKKNSSSVCIAQLSLANNAISFAWFCKFSEPPSEANMWAHSRCWSTAWSLGAVKKKFSDFKLIPLNIHPWPTIFITKAAITLNNFGSVSRVNLLMNVALHWYWVFKNHNGRSRPGILGHAVNLTGAYICQQVYNSHACICMCT